MNNNKTIEIDKIRSQIPNMSEPEGKILLERCRACFSFEECPHRYRSNVSGGNVEYNEPNYERVNAYIQDMRNPSTGQFKHVRNDYKDLDMRENTKRRLGDDEHYAINDVRGNPYQRDIQKRRLGNSSTLAPLLLAVDTVNARSPLPPRKPKAIHSALIKPTQYSPVDKNRRHNSISEVLANSASSLARSDSSSDCPFERNIINPSNQPEPLKVDPSEYIKNCTIHKNQIADKYCSECSIVCCRDCTFIPLHTNHRQKIESLSAVLPFMIQHYRNTYIPKYENKLKQLINMSFDLYSYKDELKARKDKAIKELTIKHESLKEKLEKEFKEQLTLLEESHENSQVLVKSKAIMTKILVDKTTNTLNELSNTITDDLFNFVSKQAEFANQFKQLSNSFQDLKPKTPIYAKQPSYFELLKPININLQVTEYQRLDLINPFEQIEIDALTQDVTIQFKFTKPNLFQFSNDIPKIKFHLNYMCSLCFKAQKNVPLKYVNTAEIRGELVVVKGRVIGICEHEIKWIADKDRGITLFFCLGESREKFEIYIPRLLKSFAK
jgi:hypothetical protein